MSVASDTVPPGSTKVTKARSHRGPWPLLFTIILSLWSEQPAAITINGYYKSFHSLYDMPAYKSSGPVPVEPSLGSVANRLRLNAGFALTPWLTFNAAYDLAPRIQDARLFDSQSWLFPFRPSGYRAVDFDSRLHPGEGSEVTSFAIFHNLDRAVISIAAPGFDVYVGRQAIAWGSSRAINPTDVILPFVYSELDAEDRIGVDALRLRVPIGFMAELDGGYVAGEDFEFSLSAVYLRGKFYAARTDFSLLTVGFKENLLIGFDLTRDVGQAGLWVEGAHVFVKALTDGDTDQGGDYVRGSIGLDYNLTGDTYGFIEYHFNGAGRNDASDYLDNLERAGYTEGGVYLLGKHYVVPGVSHQVSALVTAGGEVIANLSDRSLLAAPNIEYNIAQDIYVAAGAYVGLGKRARIEIDPVDLVVTERALRSEFGAYPDTYYTSFRIYF